MLLAGSSPTRMTASPGRHPCAVRKTPNYTILMPHPVPPVHPTITFNHKRMPKTYNLHRAVTVAAIRQNAMRRVARRNARMWMMERIPVADLKHDGAGMDGVEKALGR